MFCKSCAARKADPLVEFCKYASAMYDGEEHIAERITPRMESYDLLAAELESIVETEHLNVIEFDETTSDEEESHIL